jgi:hypothetical protein
VVWRPYSQAPEGLQAEKLIFLASRRVFLWTLKGLWKTAADLGKTLKCRRYRRAPAMRSCFVQCRERSFPTLSWHQAAVRYEQAL